MDSLKLRQPLLRILVLCFGTVTIAGLSACGSDSSGNPVGLSVVSSVADGAAVFANTSATPTTVTLSPTFSTTIHDYVIHCGSGANISVSFTLPGNMSLSLTEPDGTLVGPAIYATGQFSQAMAISPGQRFQFSLSGQTENYSVRCLPADFPLLTVSRVGNEVPILLDHESPLPLAQWYLFAPTLQAVTTTPASPSYIVIADSNGTPVWWKNEPLGAAIDAKILASNEIVWTVAGTGQYYVRDFNGSLLNTLTGGLDDHDLQPTPTGTFLVIHTASRICPPDCADMSPWGGSPAAAVEDAEILEIDQASNVLWTWRTRDHIALSETGEEGWFPGVGNDIIHMNALEPDGSDAVIFSARHLNAIYRIIKATGAIDWKVGGSMRPESLTVTGDTRPTALGPTGQPLSGQHDVRLWPDGTVSVHDNGTIANRSPFVMRYQIDTASRTAQVVEELSDARVTFSGCCGSARRLPGGHWLVDWGEQSFFTELAGDGLPVLTVQYPTNGTFSYRAIPVLAGILSADTLRSGMDAMSINP